MEDWSEATVMPVVTDSSKTSSGIDWATYDRSAPPSEDWGSWESDSGRGHPGPGRGRFGRGRGRPYTDTTSIAS